MTGSEFDNLKCPLTLQFFVDPVVDLEGHTYERSAITQWVREHGTSPITRRELLLENLIPNRAIRDWIEDLRRQGKIPPVTAADAEATAVPVPVPAPAASHQPHPASSQPGPVYAAPRFKVEDLVSISVDEVDAEHTVLRVSVGEPPLPAAGDPVHICCVIDVSGSMGDPAVTKNASGQTEADGLSLLDIVKHATRTIAKSLSDRDQLSIVTFSSMAAVALRPTFMNSSGQSAVDYQLNTMQANGSTKLWEGISTAIDLCANMTTHYTGVFVLTDGVPTDRDLNYENVLRRKLAKTPIFGSIYTFGFGYHLESELLNKIAQVGNGTYAFIPDAGFLGTVFINALANFKTTGAVRATVEIGTTALTPVAPWDTKPLEHSLVLNLPPLRYGSNLVLLLKGTLPPQQHEATERVIGAKIRFHTVGDHTFTHETAVRRRTTSDGPGAISHISLAELRHHILRTRLGTILVDSGCDTEARQASKRTAVRARLDEEIAPLVAELQASAPLAPETAALIEDYAGQVTEATLNKEFYSRWGRHYMQSLGIAHLQMIRNNFKDPGVQSYGGAMFVAFREEFEELFMNLPPPRPSISTEELQFRMHGVTVSAAPVSMRSYYDSSGVCFRGDTLIELASGEHMPIRSLTKGAQLRLADGKGIATLRCLTINPCRYGRTALVTLRNGLTLTPYHPVQDDSGTWVFPRDLCEPHIEDCDAVFNLVLSHGHMIRIAGVVTATLGHGIADQSVIAHEYFGTDCVVRDLMAYQSFHEQGRVVILPDHVHRDTVSGRICKISTISTTA